MTSFVSRLAGVSLVVLMAAAAATPALAQDRLTGVDRLDDQIDDITDAAEDDIERADDDVRFGPQGVVQGLRGSAAVTASGTTGNTDTGDLSFAGRINYGAGVFAHSFGFAGEYGETDGDQDDEQFYAIYEGSRYFTPKNYAFGTGRFEYDGFATNERDAFLGGGLGYRILNTDEAAWRVQAGPGIRYVQNQDDESETEGAGLASSRFYYGLTDAVSLTNDTDMLSSSKNTVLQNDLGVNFRTTDALTTRISYRTDYNSDPLPGLESTDNTLGLSLIVGF